MIKRSADSICRGVCMIAGLACFFEVSLMAQEGAGNVTPVGANASTTPVIQTTSPDPIATSNPAPTSSSGRQLQAYGAKKRKPSSSKAPAEELSVLPPRPGAPVEKKRSWFSKRKSSSSETKKQPVVNHTAAPTQQRPAAAAVHVPPSTAGNVAPTSTSGRQMQAFGAKKRKSSSNQAASGQLEVLPPRPGAPTEEKKKSWFWKRKSSSGNEAETQMVKTKSAPVPRQSVSQPVSTLPAPNVAATAVPPTTTSGQQMQAFGTKKKRSASKQASTGELNVLPPRPGASEAEKKSWFARRKVASASEAQAQPMQVKSVAAPQAVAQTTSTLPAPNAAATAVPPTSSSGKPMMAFGQKGKPQKGSGEAREDFDVLPPMVGASAEEKKRWQERNAATQPDVDYVVGSQANLPMINPSRTVAKTPEPEPIYEVYDGPPIHPSTPGGRQLQAYGQKSRHIQDHRVVAKGSKGEFGGSRWLRRATDVQGEEPSGSKWSWENPFARQRTSRLGLQSVPVGGAQKGGMVSGPEGSGTASPGVDDETELLANLKGVVVVPGTLDVKKSGRSGVSGVLTEGVEIPGKVEENFAEYLGKPLSLSVLDQMVRGAVVAFRESDMPVVDVLVPEQEINDGVLQLVVIKGRVGEVKVEGAKYTDPDFLKKQISLQQGDVLKESIMLGDLQWMNKNPFRRVDLIYSPGYSYGTTDLILRTEDMRPISFYVGVENSGNRLLGEDRILAGFNWGGPLFFSSEATFSYQYVTDFEWDRIQGHSAVWTNPLPWRHHLTLLGAFVNQDVSTMAAGEIVDIGGEDQQGSVRYTIPLRGTGQWIHEVEVGFDYKSSNSNLAFGGLDVFDTTTQIFQFGLGYNIIESDRWGSTKIDNEIIWSPGGLSGDNETDVFRSQRGGAKANYVYGRSAIERNIYLPKNWGLVVRAEGQLSDTNLLASETLGAGGYDTVRGWEERIIRGDQGLVANFELRTPSLTLANLFGYHNARDAMQLLTFFDYGIVSAVDGPDDGPGSLSLGSVGVGLRYQLDDNFSLRLDYGYQVIEDGIDDGDNGRFHFGARANF